MRVFFSIFSLYQVHFRSGIGGDSKITTTAYDIIANLESLESMVKQKAQNLEESLSQVDEYQKQIQELRKQIIREEQQLRLVMAPTYSPNDREKAATEQQVRFISIFQSDLEYFIYFVRAISLFLDRHSVFSSFTI